MSQRFKFALSQAFDAGGVEKGGNVLRNWGAGGRSGEPIHRNASGSDPVHKNPLDVVVRIRQRARAKTQSFLKPRIYGQITNRSLLRYFMIRCPQIRWARSRNRGWGFIGLVHLVGGASLLVFYFQFVDHLPDIWHAGRKLFYPSPPGL
jgi:hypothetical protein